MNIPETALVVYNHSVLCAVSVREQLCIRLVHSGFARSVWLVPSRKWNFSDPQVVLNSKAILNWKVDVKINDVSCRTNQFAFSEV